MNARSAHPPVRLEDDHDAWLQQAALPHARADRLAEALALAALVFSLGIGLVIALLPVRAAAAEVAAPSLVLSAFKVVPATASQPETLVPATEARAGDQLEYRAVYTNPTAAPVRRVQVTVPVPRTGVEVVLETISPRADLASTDGKRYAPLPLVRVETAADGHPVSRPAPRADYRFLRWDLGDVPAGATRTVRARVQLLANTAAAS